MAAANDFPARPKEAAFHREAKSPAFAILRQGSGPQLTLRVQVRSARRLRRHQGRDGRGRSDEGSLP